MIRMLLFKLNLETITKCLKKTLHSWNWKGLALIGRIKIIKTFAIPKVHTVRAYGINRILYNLFENVKRVSLKNDINKGGLKIPLIESIIDVQRISCIEKFWMTRHVLGSTF